MGFRSALCPRVRFGRGGRSARGSRFFLRFGSGWATASAWRTFLGRDRPAVTLGGFLNRLVDDCGLDLRGDLLRGRLLDGILHRGDLSDDLGDLLRGGLLDGRVDRVALGGCDLAGGRGLLDRNLHLRDLLDDLGGVLCGGLLDDSLHLGDLLDDLGDVSSAAASSTALLDGVDRGLVLALLLLLSHQVTPSRAVPARAGS